MNILIRLCDERRDAFLNFDAEEDNSTKVHIGDNLAKDILPEAIVVHTKGARLLQRIVIATQWQKMAQATLRFLAVRAAIRRQR